LDSNVGRTQGITPNKTCSAGRLQFNDAIFPHVELNAVILILLSSTDEAMPPLWSFVVGLQSIDEIVIDAKTWADEPRSI
jgi:hypothetical protein